MKFGKNGCSSIEVAAFTPVCSYDDPVGTKPLSLDVPVPTFVPPVPPNECACFTFKSTPKTVDVVPDCKPGKAKMSVDIRQADPDDCCNGNYVVTPSLELDVPCMPFDVENASVLVFNRKTSPAGIEKSDTKDGGIRLTFEKGDCCSLIPHIDIVVPDCIKKYSDLGWGKKEQIKCCDKGVEKGFDLIKMEEDKTTCNVYPVITPISLPCCTLEDRDASNPLSSGQKKLDDRSDDKAGWIKWKLTRSNCDIALDIDVDRGDCFCPTFTKKETDIVFLENKSKYGKASVEIVNTGSCCAPKYEITPTISIPSCTSADNPKVSHDSADLSNIGGKITWTLSRNDCEYGLNIVVDPITIDQITSCICIPGLKVDETATGNKYTIKYYDESATSADKTKTKTVTGNPIKIARDNSNTLIPEECRDYLIRLDELDLSCIKPNGFSNGGNVSKDSSDKKLYIDGSQDTEKTTWYGGGYGDYEISVANRVAYKRGTTMGSELKKNVSIPTVEIDARIIADVDENSKKSLHWRSQRTSDFDTSDDTSGGSDDSTVVTAADIILPWQSSSEAVEVDMATGNLNLVVPTGIQATARGTAIVMSELVYAPSGVLSEMNEMKVAAVVASPPSMEIVDNKPTNYWGAGIMSTMESMDRGDGTMITPGLGLYINEIDLGFATETGRLVINDETTGRYKDVSNGDTFERGGDEAMFPAITVYPITDNNWKNNGNGVYVIDVSKVFNGITASGGWSGGSELANVRNDVNKLKSVLVEIKKVLNGITVFGIHIGPAGTVLSIDSNIKGCSEVARNIKVNTSSSGDGGTDGE